MPQPLIVPLPPNISLWDSCRLRVVALDPTDGSIVNDVTIDSMTIQCIQLAGKTLESGDFKLVPGPGA